MENQKQLYRVVSFLRREDLDFLDDVIKDIYFSYGIKIPRAKLIEEIIESFKDIKSQGVIEEELVKRFK